MNSNANALTFQSKTFHTVQRAGQIWLRAAEIAEALGYSRADKVTQIYDRNRDEFTTAMSQNLKLRVKGYGAGNDYKEVRVFSLRGAHLIAMFSRTALAKEFRRWVLDILDREVDGLRAEVAAGHHLDELALRDVQGLCTHAEFLRSWWARFGPAIRQLNDKVAADVHDHFTHGAMASRGIVRKLGLMSNTEYAADYPWGAGHTERHEYAQQKRRIA